MKPNLLTRILAAFLVPCVLVDPALAAEPITGAMRNGQRAMGPDAWLMALPSFRMAPSLFESQALELHVLAVRAPLDPVAAYLARMTFGARARLMRHAAGIRSVDRVPGISAPTIRRIENHDYLPSDETLQWMAEAYGVTADILLAVAPQVEFGPWLATLRNNQKLGLDAFARLIGMHPVRFGLMEQDKIAPTRDELRAYAGASKLLFGTDPLVRGKLSRKAGDTFQSTLAALKSAQEAWQTLEEWRLPWKSLRHDKNIEIPYRPEDWLQVLAKSLSILEKGLETLVSLKDTLSTDEQKVLLQEARWPAGTDAGAIERYRREGMRFFGKALSMTSDAYGIPVKHFAREAGENEHWAMPFAKGRGRYFDARWARNIALAARRLVDHPQSAPLSPVLLSIARDQWHELQGNNDVRIGDLIKIKRLSSPTGDETVVSQDELAKRSGVGKSTIRFLEEGTFASRSRRLLDKVCSALNEPFEKLFAPLAKDLLRESELEKTLLEMAQSAVKRLDQRRKVENWNSSSVNRRIGRSFRYLHHLVWNGGGTRFDINLLQRLSNAGMNAKGIWPPNDLALVYFRARRAA